MAAGKISSAFIVFPAGCTCAFNNRCGARSEAGFGLVELVVVVGIIGILAGFVFVVANLGREEAQQVEVVHFAEQVNRVLGAYCAGWWDFEQVEGVTVKDTCSDNDGIFYSGAIPAAPTVVDGINNGMALSVGGISDFIDVGDPDSLRISNDRTISAWIRTSTKPTGNAWIVSKASWGYALGVDWNGYLYGWSASATSSSVKGDTDVVDDRWHHIVWTFEENSAEGNKLYLDGSLHKSSSSGEGDGGPTISLKIGDGYVGLIDNVRIYEQALVASEVRQLYTQSLAEYRIAKY